MTRKTKSYKDSRLIINKGILIKSLSHHLKKHGGRNNQGKITLFHRGGGHKRFYRSIHWKYVSNHNIILKKVLHIQYDPNRTAPIALLKTLWSSDIHTPLFSYCLATNKMKVGSILTISRNLDYIPKSFQPGDTYPLKWIPIGVPIHGIELDPLQGGKLVRSAGSSATLLDKSPNGQVLVKLPSKKSIWLSEKCLAIFGMPGNINHQHTTLGSAGAARHLGIKPTVRGQAMNPVDHPNGGRSNGGKPLRSRWGKHAK